MLAKYSFKNDKKMTFWQSKTHLECQGLHSVTKESQFNEVLIDILLKPDKEERYKEIILPWNYSTKNSISQYPDPSISVIKRRILTCCLERSIWTFRRKITFLESIREVCQLTYLF